MPERKRSLIREEQSANSYIGKEYTATAPIIVYDSSGNTIGSLDTKETFKIISLGKRIGRRGKKVLLLKTQTDRFGEKGYIAFAVLNDHKLYK